MIPTASEMPANAHIQACLAWDRNGSDDTLTFDEVASYGSAKIGYFIGTSKTTMTHFIAAETIGEKTAYCPTGNEPRWPNAWHPYLNMAIKSPA